MDRRKERIARNETIFRELNESLETHVHGGRSATDLAGFVCECGELDCEATVRLELSDYETTRRDPRQFVLVPGHELPDAEDVVRNGDGYIVVRKHEDAADVVEQTDPRGRLL
jgi:hypothetical protein